MEPNRNEQQQPADGFPWILFAIPALAIVVGQFLMGLYDDDHQSGLNAGLPIGLVLTAVGVIFLAVFALIAVARTLRGPRR